MNVPVDCFADGLEEAECFAWGHLFNSSWDDLVEGMRVKAESLGLVQEASSPYLIWKDGDTENCRWVFLADASNVQGIRDLYNNEANAESPACYVVVKQVQMDSNGDRYDTRGDVIFDIFRLSPESYMWHHDRVYTP
jgi:hypothetical protein